MFNNFRIGMTHYFPNAVTSAAEARTSLKRIEVYMLIYYLYLKNSDALIMYSKYDRNSYCWMKCQKRAIKQLKGKKVSLSWIE